MTFGEKIYKIRTEKQMTQDELAKRVGYKSRSTIAKIESGERDASQSMIVALAQALGTTPSSLMGWDESAPIDAVPHVPESMIPIPVIGEVAAGYTCLAQMEIEGYELVDPETIHDGYEYAWLRVKGNSMEPIFLEGDLVLVRIQDSIENSDYAVVIVDDEDGLVKKIKKDNQSIVLESINPYYPPRQFLREDANRVRIFGKVVESKRKFV